MTSASGHTSTLAELELVIAFQLTAVRSILPIAVRLIACLLPRSLCAHGHNKLNACLPLSILPPLQILLVGSRSCLQGMSNAGIPQNFPLRFCAQGLQSFAPNPAAVGLPHPRRVRACSAGLTAASINMFLNLPNRSLGCRRLLTISTMLLCSLTCRPGLLLFAVAVL